ncbi:MAG: putative transcriptional regulator (GntR-family) [Ilumatobacteraceae bacterium]|nr:putative transcriptional regulator (GntR-family) [Ilumatobacteraceae bacterium]
MASPPQHHSAVKVAVDKLRVEILDKEDGEWLGSEDEILVRLGVSKPTLRQAARILEVEQLLVAKRGMHGGLFARRPTEAGVVTTATSYLRSRRTTFTDLTRALFASAEESARLAADRNDSPETKDLVAFLEGHASADEAEADLAQFARARTEFTRLLGEATGNPVLTLFAQVIWTLSLVPSGQAVFLGTEDRVEATRAHAALARGLRKGDRNAAARAVRRLGDATLRSLATSGDVYL